MRNELLRDLISYASDDYCSEQDAFLLTLIDDAIEEVANEMYPYGFSGSAEEQRVKDMALKRYKGKIRKIAQYHYDKQGNGGVIGFSENGTTVSYESTGTPSSYLRGIIPVVKIV